MGHGLAQCPEWNFTKKSERGRGSRGIVIQEPSGPPISNPATG